MRLGLLQLWIALVGPFVAIAAICAAQALRKPGIEDLERAYIIFVDQKVTPLAKRDGVTHTSGGCDIGADDLLCVECFRPYGEVWVLCNRWGCELLETNEQMKNAGTVPGVCEGANGLAVAFERGTWK